METRHRAASPTPVVTPGNESGQETQSLSSYVAKKLLSIVYNPFSRKNTESPAPVLEDEGPIDSSVVSPDAESASEQEQTVLAKLKNLLDAEDAPVDTSVQTANSRLHVHELQHDDNVFGSMDTSTPSSIARMTTPLVPPQHSGYYGSPPSPTPVKRVIAHLPSSRDRKSNIEHAPVSTAAQSIKQSSMEARAIDNMRQTSSCSPRQGGIKRRAAQDLRSDEDSRLVSPKRWRYKTPGSEYETEDDSPLFTPRTALPDSSESLERKRLIETREDDIAHNAPVRSATPLQSQVKLFKDFVYVPGAYYTRRIDDFIGAMPRSVSALDFAMDSHLVELRRNLPLPSPKPRVRTSESRLEDLEGEAQPGPVGGPEILRRCGERIAAVLAQEEKQALVRHNSRSKQWNEAAALRRQQVPSYAGFPDPRMGDRSTRASVQAARQIRTSSRRRVLARSETFIDRLARVHSSASRHQVVAPSTPTNQVGRRAGRRVITHAPITKTPPRRSYRAPAGSDKFACAF